MHILIVDDDTELSQMLTDYLKVEGFHVDQSFDGEQGLAQASSGNYEAVVLDVMMPGLDGFEVLRRLRAHSEVPVLMLTAKGDDVDRIVGLEIGADDYLPKPFNPRELLARLRAILRRSTRRPNRAGEHPEVLQLADLELHPASRSVIVGGQGLDLTSTEFNLLHTLMKQAGQVISKENLSSQALGRKLERYDRSVDMHMSNLRRKLAPHDLDRYILTVRGQGYQLSSEP